jgi:hypothetical protein
MASKFLIPAEAAKRYITQKGNHCPVCNYSGYVEYGPDADEKLSRIEFSEGNLVAYSKCSNCGAVIRETYFMKMIDLVEPGTSGKAVEAEQELLARGLVLRFRATTREAKETLKRIVSFLNDGAIANANPGDPDLHGVEICESVYGFEITDEDGGLVDGDC